MSEDISTTDSQWHTMTIRIPFVSAKHAAIAKQVIDVDRELQPQSVKRLLTTEDEVLVATFKCLTVRLTRLTINSFLENVELVVRTLEEFSEDASQTTESTTSA